MKWFLCYSAGDQAQSLRRQITFQYCFKYLLCLLVISCFFKEKYIIKRLFSGCSCSGRLASVHVSSSHCLFISSVLQIAAMQAGLLKVVPQAVLDLLTWQEVEKKVCGDPEISVEALKRLSECPC